VPYCRCAPGSKENRSEGWAPPKSVDGAAPPLPL
jgi:hypothetical protein